MTFSFRWPPKLLVPILATIAFVVIGVVAAPLLLGGGDAPPPVAVAQSDGQTLRIPIEGAVNQSFILTSNRIGPQITGDTVFQITSTPGTTIQFDNLVFSENTCRHFEASANEWNTVTSTGNRADGNDVASAPTSTVAVSIPTVATRDPQTFDTSNYDKVLFVSVGGGQVRDIIVTGNGFVSGDCLIENTHGNTVTLEANEFGNGDGLAAEDYVIDSTNKIGAFNVSGDAEVAGLEVP
jgi:hypothetical protein